MSKHTPGPWEIDGGTNPKGDKYIWKKGEYYGGHAIATVHEDIQEGAEGNARLVAAAPELLAACKYAKKYIESLPLSGFSASQMENIGVIDSYITAAIAKATE